MSAEEKDPVQFCVELFRAGYSQKYIENALSKKGFSSKVMEDALEELDFLKAKNKRKQGTYTILAGVALLGIGFIITVALYYQNASMGWAMYGLTGIGILLVIIGCVNVFGGNKS